MENDHPIISSVTHQGRTQWRRFRLRAQRMYVDGKFAQTPHRSVYYNTSHISHFTLHLLPFLLPEVICALHYRRHAVSKQSDRNHRITFSPYIVAARLIMIQEAKPHSVAGSWGSERKKPLLVPKTSSSRDAFRVQTQEEIDELKNDPFARFKNVQDKNPMLLSYNKRLAHIDDSSHEQTEDVDPRMTTTARSMNVSNYEEHSTNCHCIESYYAFIYIITIICCRVFYCNLIFFYFLSSLV